jgi:hypothetical protein
MLRNSSIELVIQHLDIYRQYTFLCASPSHSLIMTSSLPKTEPYPFELPTTPPTPCPSPTLQYASLLTALMPNLPDDGDPELQSLTCSQWDAVSSSKRPKTTGVSITSLSYSSEVETEDL